MNNQKLTEAAERIAKVFGSQAFTEQTYKVRDILADLVPSLEHRRKQLKQDIQSVIEDLEDTAASL